MHLYPPISIYFLSKQLDKKVWLAQAAVFFAVMNLVKIIPYSVHNSWNEDLLLACLILFPFALLGVKLGAYFQKHISQESFVKVCRGLLGVSGVILLVKIF